MNLPSGKEKQFVTQIAIQVVKYQATQELGMLPMIRENMELVSYIESRVLSMMLLFKTKFLSGETWDETRSVEYEYKTYASWWDHFKDSLKPIFKNKKWFPKSLYYRILKIKIQYKTEKKFLKVPVKVLRVCPHLDKKFTDNDMYHHCAFLNPSTVQPDVAVWKQFESFANWIRTSNEITSDDARDEIARAAERVARQFKSKVSL